MCGPSLEAGVLARQGLPAACFQEPDHAPRRFPEGRVSLCCYFFVTFEIFVIFLMYFIFYLS